MTGLEIKGSLDNWSQHLDGNLVNGKELLYFWTIHDTIIDMSLAGQVIVANCQNMVLENGFFTNTSKAVSIVYSDQVEIKEMESFECRMGVYILQSNNCDIEQVTIHTLARGISTRSTDGIVIEKSTDCHILNAEIYLTNTAVKLSESADCSILESNLYSNIESIDCETSQNVLISGNVVYKSCTNGISLTSCSNCIIMQNYVFESETKSGIVISGISNILVKENIVIDNSWVGILVLSWEGNISIYGNSIGWNGRYNAQDGYAEYWNPNPSGLHLWDDGVSTGNKWNNYSGSGEYQIPGKYGAVDNYPSILSEKPSLPSFPSGSVPSTNTTTQNELFLVSTSITLASIIIIVVVLVVIIRHKSRIE